MKEFGHRLTSRALTVFCAALLLPAAQALDPNRLLEQYIHDRWTAAQGYPGGVISTIAQTPDGYVWLGGEKGLVRFDGITFRTYNHANTDLLPASGVLSLVTDREGSLWILMESRQLLRYRAGVFESIYRATLDVAPWTEAGATAIARDANNNLLVVRQGVISRYVAQKFEPVAPTSAYPIRLIISMAEGPDGTLWMGARDHGLVGLRTGKSADASGLPDRKVNCLLAGAAGELWIGTDHGLAAWNGRKATQDGVPGPLRTAQVLAIARDRDSNLWLGTAHGLARMTPLGGFEQDPRNAGRDEAVGALFEDREGSIWIGGSDGLERYRDRAFLTYSPPGTDRAENDGPVYTDPAGRTWFAPSSGGLYWLKGADRGRLTEASLGDDVIYSIAGTAGELWLGRQRGGLTHLRYQGATWSAETLTTADGLASGPIYAVHRSRDGTVWAGSLNGGVSRVRAGHATTYTTANGLPSNTVSAIEEGADGTIWLATANGLSAYSQNAWRVFTSSDGLPPGRINCLFGDASGVLWIGTDVGLAYLQNGRIHSPRDAAEPLSGEIFGIAEDGACCLWISGSKHLARVPRAPLLAEAGHAGSLREFGPADGVPSPEGVRRSRSVVQDSFGRIWFSLRRGISVIEPARLSSSSAPAIVQIESVSADGNPLDPAAAIKIPSSRVRIRFDYIALSLAVPERVRYRYRLDGQDQAWSEPTSERSTLYMNLPPRSYRFRVIASNSEGLWNSSEATIAMEVVPPMWQTWAFRLSATGALALIAVGLYRLRLRRLTQQLNLVFQERLDERTRIAQELHDTLLQGLLATSMHLHVVVDRLPAEAATRSQLTRVTAMLQQVVSESRNAVRGLRAEGTSSDNLERAFAKVREELSVPESTGFRIIAEGPRWPLNPLIRDQVYRIGREALTNAFRHSGADSVEVEITSGAHDFRLAIRDTGCGIDEEVLRSGRDGHWGLIGMRECAAKIGGDLKLRSAARLGTELELTIPAHIAFLKTGSGRAPWWRFRRKAKTGE